MWRLRRRGRLGLCGGGGEETLLLVVGRGYGKGRVDWVYIGVEEELLLLLFKGLICNGGGFVSWGYGEEGEWIGTDILPDLESFLYECYLEIDKKIGVWLLYCVGW
jgi:hypothetical protein